MGGWRGIVAAAAFACCAASCASAPGSKAAGGTVSHDGWRSLFDGKTLNGWTPKIRGFALGENYANTFRIEDGMIRVSYDQYGGKFGDHFGHLF